MRARDTAIQSIIRIECFLKTLPVSGLDPRLEDFPPFLTVKPTRYLAAKRIW